MAFSLRKKLAPNFVLGEFVAHDVEGWNRLDETAQEIVRARLTTLAQTLEVIRQSVDTSIIITSGYRSVKHNKAVGGAPTSDHTRGWACDCYAKGMRPADLYVRIRELAALREIVVDQVILYPHHVHVSVGPKRREQFFQARR